MCDKSEYDRDVSSVTSGVKEIVGILKPFLVAALIIVAGVLQYKGLIDSATFNLIISVLGGGVVASVQTAQRRLERKTDRAIRSLGK